MATADIYNMADAWNAGATTFTAIKMDVTDTASAAGSRLLDLLVNGASKFSVDKAGIAKASSLVIDGTTADTVNASLSILSGGLFINTPAGTGGNLSVGGNTAISYTSSTVSIRTSLTERMRVTTAGLVGIGHTAPDTILDIAGAFTFRERTSDPADPDEGASVLWMSDGTGLGDDGDVMMKITAGGVTKSVTIVDHSAV